VERIAGNISGRPLVTKHKKPPKVASWILRQLLPHHIGPEGLGDYEELYRFKAEAKGSFKAKSWYWSQILIAFSSLFAETAKWNIIMLKNYLKIAIRYFQKQKVYSLINLSGLAVGMACCILILLWVYDELSYDRYHENADRVYRITYAEEIGGAYDHYALAPFASASVFTEELSEVEAFTRLWNRSGLITHNERTFEVHDIFYVDPDFFKIFTFNITEGDPDTALNEPGSIVLTEESAHKIFRENNPVGQTLNLNGDGDLLVTGVIKNTPKNSHFRFSYLISINTIQGQRAKHLQQWQTIEGWSYILLTKTARPNEVEKKMAAIVERHAGEEYRKFGARADYFLQKLTDIHLKSHLQAETEGNGNIHYVYVFSLIAFFILLIACINFMNLSTARSANRGKEVGLRKVFGAHKTRLIKQFIAESTVLAFLGLFSALFLVWFLLPFFSNLTGKEVGLGQLNNGVIIGGFLGLVIITGLVSGSYPAFSLSSFQPVDVIRNKLHRTSQKSRLRNVLVTLQFAISVALIISTFIVLDQLKYMKNQKLGFDKEQVLAVRLKDKSKWNSIEPIKTELMKNPHILSTSASHGIPGYLDTVLTLFQEGKAENESHTFDIIVSDYDYIETYGIELIDGRDFSREFAADADGAFLINETAQTKLEWGKATVGKKIGFSDETMWPIVGIIKDFHYKSLKESVGPLAILLRLDHFSLLSIKMNTENISGTIDFIKKTWQTFEKDRTFEYFFVDENFDSLYYSEKRLSRVISYFAAIAIFIACLGLFGLASFTAEQSRKEIGIRKVMGATIQNIVFQLSRNFLKWVVIANLIAWPLTFYVMEKYWLATFPYRIDPSISTFLIAGTVSLLIALFTVSYQSIKAALANPAATLRAE
jgi:putative ABC transport system permease protein